MILKSMVLFTALVLCLFTSQVIGLPPVAASPNHNLFAAELFSNLVEQKSSQNIIYSPISIQTALGLAFIGAEGRTAEEMRDVLRLGEGDKTQVAENFGDFVRTLSKSKKVNEIQLPQLTIANRIYVAEDKKISPEFNRIAQEYFDAVAENLNFADKEKAANTINKWIEEQTENKIHDLVKPNSFEPSSNAMVLVNAIYYKAQWLHPFVKSLTKNQIFNINSKEQEEVELMFNSKNYKYAELSDLDAKVLELPYNNSDISMLIILPNDVEGLEKLETKLKNLDLNVITSKMTTENIDVYLPKFRIEYEVDLIDVLEDMGLLSIFTRAADFRGILETDQNLFISKVLHKAYLSVDEYGSEATAATVDLLMTESLKKEFRVDHPFIFAIRSDSTVYFSGHVARI